MTKHIDLEKLEALSCLKIDESKKSSMIDDINGVVDMLHSIDQINVVSIPENHNNPTQLANDLVNGEYCFDKEQPSQSVNIQDGVFLAPKVISK